MGEELRIRIKFAVTNYICLNFDRYLVIFDPCNLEIFLRSNSLLIIGPLGNGFRTRKDK